MTYFACAVHKCAFPSQQGIKGHMAFRHPKGEPREVVPYETREQVPADYRVEEKTWSEKTGPKRPKDKSPEDPGKIETGSDPEAATLARMLDSVGVNERDIAACLKGYMNLPQLRDPQNLDNWLRTHIQDKRLHGHIPLVVGAVFELGEEERDAPRYYLGRGGEQAPRYGYRRGREPSSGDHRYGYTGDPAPDYPRRGPYRSLEPDDSQDAMAQVRRLEGTIEEMKRNTEREATERLAREKEEKLEARLDRLEQLIVSLDTERETSGKANPLLEEIKALRGEVAETRLGVVKDEVKTLREELKAVSGKLDKDRDPGEASLETAAIRLGPSLLEKAAAAGKDFVSELKGIREQGLKAPAQKPVARTTEEMLRLGEAENEIVALAQRRGKATPPQEAQSAEAETITAALKAAQGEPPAPEAAPAAEAAAEGAS